jgi:predicted lactoylglutathione lyase
MKPKIGLITLGVQDVQRAKAFYLGLGFTQHGEAKEDEQMIMLKAEGTWLGLYPWKLLAEDAQVPASDMNAFRGVTLAHLEPTKADVDRVIDEARALGAKVVKEAQDVFWGGYSGYFVDLDGHLWEVAMNPFTDLV